MEVTMKTSEQIKQKIAEHEVCINALLNNPNGLDDCSVNIIQNYLIGRKGLLWALSDENLIEIDAYEHRVKYECLCYESSKIF
jgi:hypothetical protein